MGKASSGHGKNADSSYDNAIKLLFAALVILAAFNAFTVWSIIGGIDSSAVKALEDSKPAKLSILTIKSLSCTECSSVDAAVAKIKSNSNIEIASEKTLDFDSGSAEVLDAIQKYNIDVVPAIIVSGEVGKSAKVESFLKGIGVPSDDGTYMTVKASVPPYVDAATKEVIGFVSATLIKNSACIDCQSLDSFVDQMVQAGVNVKNNTVIEYSSDKAKELISKYNITTIPTLVLSKDAGAYELLSNAWVNIGTVEADGSYVTRLESPPYFDLVQDRIVGLVGLTSITDSSCATCYNVSVHKQILGGIGMKFVSESTYDISSDQGKQLLQMYNITNVPTIILSKDAADYELLVKSWPAVGTVESDGAYVFRNVSVMTGYIYKDLSTGELLGEADLAAS